MIHGIDLPKIDVTTPLTVIVECDDGHLEAEKDIEKIKNYDCQIVKIASEMYFHQLRLKVAEDPDFEKKVKVYTKDKNGELVEIKLKFGDELRWPEDFLLVAWRLETAIMVAREKNKLKEER